MTIALFLAAVIPAAPFSDHAVLQRERPVPVWGRADPGEKVSVSFAGVTKETAADAEGRWRVDLPALKASDEGRDLRINDKVIRDVLVGEVWMCSGQSNMEIPVVGSSPRARDRQGAMVGAMTRMPKVRFMNANDLRSSPVPLAMPEKAFAWKELNFENVGGDEAFTAIGYYFVRELHIALGIPVGIVGTYWGGTRIEPWTPKAGFDSLANGAKLLELGVNRKDKRPHQEPMGCWNRMVEPFAPMAMRGLLWHQGCANAGESDTYCELMHALYNGWSKRFENPDLELYFCQLAAYRGNFYPLQLAQAKFAREEKHAAMVVTADAGNLADIHPNEKEIVARRLALLALARDYGFAFDPESPTFVSAKAEGDAVRIVLDHAKGLYHYRPDWTDESGFEIAGADGVFKPAKIANFKPDYNSKGQLRRPNGVLVGEGILLKADGVTAPAKVRHLFKTPFLPCFFNGLNLPLGAFEASL